MAIITDPGIMDGAAMRTTEAFDDQDDAMHSVEQVGNAVYNLWHHRHIDGEGTLIPPEGLSDDATLARWFYD